MKVKLRDAAEHAQVSIRTIWNWLRQYKLTKYTMGNEAMVDLGQVNAVIDAKERVAPTPQLLAVIIRRLEKIERDVEVLLYAGGYTTSLDLTAEQAVLAYQVAQQQSKRQSLTDTDIEELTVMLRGISEEFLEVIQIETDEPHPWKAFYELAVFMQRQLKGKKRFSTDLELQKQFMELVSVRTKLQELALIFIEADTDSSSRRVLMAMLGPGRVLESEILRRVLWKKSIRPPGVNSILPDDPHELLNNALTLLETEVNDKSLRRKIVTRLERAIDIIKSQK